MAKQTETKPETASPLGALDTRMVVTLVPETKYLAEALAAIGEALVSTGVALQDAATALGDAQDMAEAPADADDD